MVRRGDTQTQAVVDRSGIGHLGRAHLKTGEMFRANERSITSTQVNFSEKLLLQQNIFFPGLTRSNWCAYNNCLCSLVKLV